MWQVIGATIISALLSGGVLAATLGILTKRRSEVVAAEVKRQFEEAFLQFRSSRLWREQSYAELLAPVVMQLQRTERGFKRLRAHDGYVEAKIIGDGNATIRSLLLTKGHLIPADLLDDAHRLIEHYDRWLEEFERVRRTDGKASEAPFVFVGPAGFPFPKDAATRFEKRYAMEAKVLYPRIVEQPDDRGGSAEY